MSSDALYTEEPLPGLPADRALSSARRTHSVVLGAELSQQLAVGFVGIPLEGLLMTAFAVFLHRLTNQDEIFIERPAWPPPEDAGASTLRVDFSGAPTFRSILAEVCRQDHTKLHRLPSIYEHPDVGQARFAFYTLGPGADPHADPAERIEPGELALRIVAKSRISYELRYRMDVLLPAMEAAALVRCFETLLLSVGLTPDCGVAQLSLLPEEQRQLAVLQWNQTEASYPQDRCIHQLVEAQAAKSPAATALVCGTERLSYRQLDQRAEQLARLLRRHPTRAIGPDVLVALHIKRSTEAIVGILAVLKAGGAYVPLDPSLPAERLQWILRDTGSSLVLTHSSIAAQVAGLGIEYVCLDQLDLDRAEESSDPADAAPRDGHVGPHHLAYVIYTSGSTGRPKGVMVEHGGVCNLVTAWTRRLGISAECRVLQCAALSFDVSVLEIFAALTAGAELHLIPQEQLYPGPDLLRLLRERRINVMDMTASALATLPVEALPELRTLITGGEVCPAELVARWAPGRSFYNTYGPTETTIVSTIKQCREEDGQPTIGRPVPNCQVYVLDRHLQPVPIGAEGELFIGGVGLARGYLNQPELTEQRFLPNPFGPGRLYRTGDLVRFRSDGELSFVGRADQQIKLRGFRIELGEIESVLAAHPKVASCLVRLREDVPGDKRLCAYLVARPDCALSVPALRDYLGSKLPAYMVPSAFVLLDALPLTLHGKLDTKALPAPSVQETPPPGDAARTPVEQILADIFAQVLHVEKVGTHQDFFALGGHSLLATQVVSRLRSILGLELPLRTLFEARTVAALAAFVTQQWGTGPAQQAESIPITPRTGDLPLSFAQRRLWFIDQLDAGNPVYNIPAALRLRGPLDISALQRALTRIVERHEALRTRFDNQHGQPVQRIDPVPAVWPLPVLDVADESGAQSMQAEASTPFDLQNGPLLRTTVLRLGLDDHVLLLTLHHIVADGWSMGVLMQELSALYNAFAHAQPDPLPPLQVQLADVGAWQRAALSGEALDRELLYWRQKLTGSEPLSLPTDYPRPPLFTFRGSTLPFSLSAELTAALKQVAQEQGVTLFMLLLAAFKVLLGRYSRQQDISIGSLTANRTRTEMEPLIGFFVNTLVLRTSLEGDPTFSEFLARVKTVCLEAYAHQSLPFDQLVEAMQVKRDLGRNPLFQVMFVLQNAPIGELALDGLVATDVETPPDTAKFDLLLSMREAADGCLVGGFEYASDLFTKDSISRMGGHFARLLQGVADDPRALIARLPLLSPAERQQIAVTWNDTQAAFPSCCLHELIEAQAEHTPDAIAVVYKAQQLTYSELNERANQLAHHLRSLGVSSQERVGLCLLRSPEMVIAMLGVMKAGGAYVPLDPDYPLDRLAYMLKDAHPRVVLTTSLLASRLPAPETTHVHLDADGSVFTDQPQTNPQYPVLPEHLIYVLYTSGSTGQPKGVPNTHRGLCNRITWMQAQYRMTPADRVLQKTPFSFDVSGWEFFWPLIVGARLILAAPGGHRDPGYLASLIAEAQITHLHFVPSMLSIFLEQPDLQKACRSLQKVYCSGEALAVEQVRAFYRQLPSAELHNLYGPTEAAIDVSYFPCADALERTSIPIGRPIANTQLYILDPAQQLVPIGVPGEIHIGGVGLARGYLNRPELTVQKFIADPFDADPSARLYKTGDLGRFLPDGNIEFLGRIDHQIKLRGFRIELGEIESVLAEHPIVQAAIVLLREDRPGDQRLVGYIVAKKDDRAQSEHLAQWLSVWQQTYGQAAALPKESASLIGWNSSYTGAPIPAPEMAEWTDNTVAEVLALAPQRVLEIGCGSGLLLSRIAPTCSAYVATDYTSESLEHIRSLQQATKTLERVTLLQRAGDDFTDIPERSFDLVLINSVAQYFPSQEYLLRVLRGAAQAVKPGGVVYLGDVRNLQLLGAFHASVQLHQAADQTTRDELAARVQQRLQDEEELLIDPELFRALPQLMPEVRGVQIRLKRGTHHNEMSCFRYQALLKIGDGPSADSAPSTEWSDWSQAELSLEKVAQRLRSRPQALAIRGIPNARLQKAAATLQWLSAEQEQTVGALRQALAHTESPGIDPEALWMLSKELGYEALITWSASAGPMFMDAIFWVPGEPLPAAPSAPLLPKPLSAYTNNPLLGKQRRMHTGMLRQFLQTRLPEYMLPAVFVFLDAFPLGASGKADRKALPAPSLQPLSPDALVPPRTPVEQILADVFAEVLHLEKVGVQQDFFALGGHSLLATQAVSRIRSTLGLDLPLRTLFESPTVAALAVIVEQRFGVVAPRPSDPILPVPRSGPLPLSFAQQRLWFIDQLEPGRAVYNIPTALHLQGTLDCEALQRALTQIVTRHEALRTRFDSQQGQPLQIIEPPPETWRLPLVRVAGSTDAERHAAVAQLAQIEANTPFDLQRGPLLRTTLLHLSADYHVLLLTLHHIVSDGWSTGVFVHELSALYSAFARGLPDPLAALPVQLVDIAAWQRGAASRKALAVELSYWQQQLAGCEPLDLPTDFPRPPVLSYRGRNLPLRIPAPLASALKELARQHGVTLYMLLLASFKVLLFRYTHQRDLSVGSPIANRTRSEMEPLIGCFVNTLVLRSSLSHDPTFVELLSRVRSVCLQAYAHQSVPFEQLVESLHLSRDLSRNPLFQVMFVLQNAPERSLELGGLVAREVELDTETAKCDLTLSLEEGPEGSLVGGIEYATDLFTQETVARMTGHLVQILEGVLADPRQRIGMLPLLTDAERQQLLVQWNATDTRPPTQCVHTLVEAQAHRAPDAQAVVYEGEVLSYRELNERANQIAHRLRELGVGAESLVGLCVERSLEMVIGLLGILKAGGAYVPLDPSHPPDRLAYILGDAAPAVMITQRALLTQLPPLSMPCIFADEPSDLAAQPRDNPAARSATHHLAYVLYTSGSTGRPKGVLIEHGSLMNLLHSMQKDLGFESTDVLLAVTTLSFDIAGLEIWLPLLAGGRLVVAPRSSVVDGQLLGRSLRDCGATVLQATPSTWRALCDAGWPGEPNLQALVGGEAVPADLADAVAQKARTAWNVYGPTETTIWSTRKRLRAGDHRVSIGRPIENTRIYILDEAMQPLPIGVPGQLHIGGLGLARGYLNRPELTAQKFVPDPFSIAPDARLYATGDRARYLPDGQIEFLGRMDNQIKLRGFRIELGEIEAVLGAHPLIRSAAVLLREDRPGDKRLCAYLVAKDASAVSLGVLRLYLASQLPEYMVPSSYVYLDELPLTANGKVDRKRLPAPAESQPQSQGARGAQAPVEQLVAEVFAQVLHRGSVGREQNFFELGGHSLLATQVISRLRTMMQVELPLRALFEAPTATGLAERIERLWQGDGAGEIDPTNPLDRIERIDREGAAQPSFAQQRLWFIDQMEPGQAAYNIPFALRLRGPLDEKALGYALSRIVARHEALRTRFVSQQGQLVQLVDPPPPPPPADGSWPLPVVRLDGLPGSDAEAALHMQRESRLPFDLLRGPLVRTTLLRLGADHHILLLTLHHIIADGWSIGVLLHELDAQYCACVRGLGDPLPALPVQLADVAAWQRRALGSEALGKSLAYWQQQLADCEPLDLPVDAPRPPVFSYRGRALPLSLSPTLTAGLKELARQQGVTLYMLLLASFKVLLFRYTHQRDLSVGSPIANRTRSEMEPLIGCFVNTLVLRSSLSHDPTFVELLSRVRSVCLQAYAHQSVPFEQLVESLHLSRDLSRNPLFQVMFVLQNAPEGALQLGGLVVEELDFASETAKCDLTLNLAEKPDGGLVGGIEYATDLFTQETVARMAGHLVQILEGVLADPLQRIGTLPLLTDAERQQLLVQWNDTGAELPSQPVHKLIEAQAHRTPDAVAVVYEGEELSYKELNERANQVAHRLRKLGVGADVLVGLCVERSPEMAIGLLGILKAGGAYVPLDPRHPSDRLAYILQDTQLQIMLVKGSLAERFATCSVRQLVLDRDREVFAAESRADPSWQVGAADLCYVTYTSGSTGQPKGVCITHHNVMHSTAARLRSYVRPVHRFLLVLSMAFDSAAAGIFWTLCQGGALVLPLETYPQDPATLLALLAAQRITHILCVPSLYAFLLEQGSAQELGTLSTVSLGGEALPQSVVERHHAQLPQADLFNEYGPTEATVWCTVYKTSAADPLRPSIPIGRPIANTQIYILDQAMQPLPIGVAGQLHIGSAGLGRGYLNRPELTALKFVPNPFGPPGSRLYATGDRARYLPDGQIEFLGRMDTQIKLRGFRIELGEIESVLSAHPLIHRAAVALLQDLPGSPRLCAYVVAKESAPLPLAALRLYLASKLPEYMVPTSFVSLDELPLTASGKVDRKKLPAPAQDEAALPVQGARTPIEQLVAEVFALLLQRAQVGVNQNFFELGGHSLLATQAVSRLRTLMQVELPLRALFEAPTAAALAERISQQWAGDSRAEAEPIARIERTGAEQPSYAQQRLWFIDQMDPGQAVYNIPVALRLRGPLDQEALGYALSRIVARHEALRTRFVSQKGQLVQIIDPAPETAVLPVVQLDHAAESTLQAEVARRVQAESTTPFDLQQGPLLRAKLLHLGAAHHILLLTLHHIIADGWSMGVMMQELSTLYAARTSGQADPLPPLSVQVADVAAWQRRLLSGELLRRDLPYWQQKLADCPPLDLPTDWPRPPVFTYRGRTRPFDLPSELSSALTSLARKQGVTLYMLLLAGFNVLLSRYSQRRDVCVGTPIANRTRTELEPLIGFLVNTLVLRTSLEGDPSFIELLERVRTVCLEAYAHQSIPFEHLVDALQVPRDLSRNPLFQVMFVLQNAPTSPLRLPGVAVTELEAENESAKFDLTLTMWEEDGRLVGFFEYATDLFAAETIARLQANFEQLLRGIVQDPAARIAQLPLLTAAERHLLLDQWNQTQSEIPLSCVHQLIRAQSERAPAAVAVLCQDEQLTYGDLSDRADQLADCLRGLGVGPDVLVGLCVDRSVEMVVGLLGILYAGGAYLPLDPDHPRDRLAFVLKDACPTVVVAQRALLDRLPPLSVPCVLLDQDAPLKGPSLSSDQVPTLAGTPSIPRPGQLAYVMYTSGSTGQPKGVMIEHRALTNLLHSMQKALDFGVSDVWLAVTTLSFDIAGLEIWLPLMTGARLVLAPRSTVMDGHLLAKALSDCAATVLQATPSGWRALCEAGWEGDPRLQALVGGEAVPAELADTLAHKTRLVWNVYGPTETTIWSTRKQLHRAERPITIGRPIDNTQIYILDALLQPVPIGVSGELYIGGAGLARGYLNRPALQAEKFIRSPFAQDADSRLYKTGDLARFLADGSIEFLGRIDHQIKLRGFRIELGEIESVLAEHPVVQVALVAPREEHRGEQRLVAYIVPRPDDGTQSEQIEQWKSAWGQTYGHAAESPDPGFNLAGWNSSYTGAPIPAHEMAEWVALTVEDVRALRPQKILEIGCGVGLLLTRLAPSCQAYFATDQAKEAIEKIRVLQKVQGNLDNVTPLHRAADDFTDLPAQSFDLVLINSVVQYFPSQEYLLRVLRGAAQAVRPGGVIYIGDVRDLTLDAAFHASVETHRAADGVTRSELVARIQQRLQDEEELLIDPALFRALPQLIPQIAEARVRIKRGRYHNEMNRFRYQVLLRVGKEVAGGAAAKAPAVQLRDWYKDNLSLDKLRTLLAQQPEGLAVRNIPSARLTQEAHALQWLSADHEQLVEKLRQELAGQSAGVDPEALAALGAQAEYHVELTGSGRQFAMDALFWRQAEPAQLTDPPSPRSRHAYTNNPLLGKLRRRHVPTLRQFLQTRVPDYMVPAAFVFLDAFPLTPNGKVDRAALPNPSARGSLSSGSYVAPRDQLELQLAELWSTVLGISPIGVRDNFFAAGGHSLLAVRLLTLIQERLGHRLPLTALFQDSTIECLAQRLRTQGARSPQSVLVTIQPTGQRPPLFCVHPGTGDVAYYAALANHLGPQQPFYAFQARGLDGTQDPHQSIEEMAAAYCDQVRVIQPSGPYFLSGHCLGGLIAFEMAHQLKSAGQEVALLALLSSPGQSYQIQTEEEEWLLSLAQDLGLVDSPQEMCHLQPEAQLQHVIELAQRKNHVPPWFGIAQMQSWVVVHRAIMHAGARYVRRPLAQRLILFRTKTPLTPPAGQLIDGWLYGWDKLSDRPVEVCEVPGTHSTLMKEPVVGALAQQLRKYLADAQVPVLI